MSVVAAAASRLATVSLHLTRLAVRHLGPGPVALALSATAALVYLLRARRQQVVRRARPQRRPPRLASASVPDPSTVLPSNSTDPGPPFLTRVRRITLGACYASDLRSQLFCHPGIQSPQNPSETPLVKPSENTAENRSDNLLENKPVNLSEKPSLSNTVALSDDVVSSLCELARRFDFYFIVQVHTDDDQHAVEDALRSAGLFEPGLLDPRKLLFCETDLGRVSVARQIDPQLHIDDSAAVVEGLQRFLPWVALISSDANEVPVAFTRNVAKFTSLATFFA